MMTSNMKYKRLWKNGWKIGSHSKIYKTFRCIKFLTFDLCVFSISKLFNSKPELNILFKLINIFFYPCASRTLEGIPLSKFNTLRDMSIFLLYI